MAGRKSERAVEGTPGGPAGPALPRPAAGVVLAAGRSARLTQVTGGDSKALVRIGGLALVERAVRRLLAVGIHRIVVVVGHRAGTVAAVARRESVRRERRGASEAPAEVRVVIADDWESGNGASLAAAEEALGDAPSFLLVTVDHVFSEGSLDRLLDAGRPAILVDPGAGPDVLREATRVLVDREGRVVREGKDVDARLADCGAFLLGPGIFRAAGRARDRGDRSLAGAINELAAENAVAAVPIPTGAWWRDVDTPRDLVVARRMLRRSLGRDTDGPVARFLNRRLSIPLSWALAPLRPPPDVLSLVALAAGFGAAVLLGTGHGVAGGITAQACSILDGMDGEVARLTLRAGPTGGLLDAFLDRIADAAVVAGLAIWAVSTGTAPALAVGLAAAASAGSMMSMATKDRVVALGLEVPSERRLGWFLGGRDGRLFLVATLAILGLPVAALVTVTATSLLASAARVLVARTVPPA